METSVPTWSSRLRPATHHGARRRGHRHQPPREVRSALLRTPQARAIARRVEPRQIRHRSLHDCSRSDRLTQPQRVIPSPLAPRQTCASRMRLRRRASPVAWLHAVGADLGVRADFRRPLRLWRKAQDRSLRSVRSIPANSLRRRSARAMASSER